MCVLHCTCVHTTVCGCEMQTSEVLLPFEQTGRPDVSSKSTVLACVSCRGGALASNNVHVHAETWTHTWKRQSVCVCVSLC